MANIKFTPLFAPAKAPPREALAQALSGPQTGSRGQSALPYSNSAMLALALQGGLQGLTQRLAANAEEAKTQQATSTMQEAGRAAGLPAWALTAGGANPSLIEGLLAQKAGNEFQPPMERERQAISAGLQRGTPAWNNFMLSGDERGRAPDATFVPNIGNDPFHQPQPGWVNPRAQTTTPAAPPAGSRPSGPLTVPGPNGPIPVPEGADPKVFLDTASKSAAEKAVGPKFDDMSGLRKEIQQLPSYKNLAQAAPIYKAMAGTAGTNSKASDLNLVYGLGKIMDPNSVVREGEMIMAKDTAGWSDKIAGWVNALNGGQALTPETRKAIMAEAHNRVTSYNDMYQQDSGLYRKIASKQGMDPEDIVQDFGKFDPWEAATPGPAVVPPPPAAAVPAQPGAMPADPLGIR